MQGISDLITIHGLVNVDFADVRTIMSSQGMALMGTGYAAGANRAVEAANQAVNSPLLEDISIEGAMGILINITGGPDMTLHEIDEAACLIQEAAHEDANIIFGSVIDERIHDELKITVIATGFSTEDEKRLQRVAPSVPAVRRAQAPVAARHPHPAVAPAARRPTQGQLPVAPRPAPEAQAVVPATAGRGRAEADRPAYLRSRPQPPTHTTFRENPSLPDTEDEYDIPTFLRKGGE